MEYKLDITPKGNYIYVQTSGERANAGVVKEVWGKIIKACGENNCYKILGVQYGQKSMKLIDIVASVPLLLRVGLSKKYKVAWVDLNKDTVSNSRMLEDYLRTLDRFGEYPVAKQFTLGRMQGHQRSLVRIVGERLLGLGDLLPLILRNRVDRAYAITRANAFILYLLAKLPAHDLRRNEQDNTDQCDNDRSH